MSDEFNMHITRLQSTRVSQIVAKISIKYLITNIERAKSIDSFYTIDYSKYGEQIINNSNVSDEEKEKMRKRFLNNDAPQTEPSRQTVVRRQRADTTVARNVQILGAPRPIVQKQQPSYDDSFVSAFSKKSSESSDDFSKGIAVRRTFRRNSTYVKRLPSQILIFA